MHKLALHTDSHLRLKVNSFLVCVFMEAVSLGVHAALLVKIHNTSIELL